eukprot:scaffold26185_cov62-Phaeocystis_antarctica.AAC.5
MPGSALRAGRRSKRPVDFERALLGAATLARRGSKEALRHRRPPVRPARAGMPRRWSAWPCAGWSCWAGWPGPCSMTRGCSVRVGCSLAHSCSLLTVLELAPPSTMRSCCSATEPGSGRTSVARTRRRRRRTRWACSSIKVPQPAAPSISTPSTPTSAQPDRSPAWPAPPGARGGGAGGSGNGCGGSWSCGGCGGRAGGGVVGVGGAEGTQLPSSMAAAEEKLELPESVQPAYRQLPGCIQFQCER